MGVHGLLSFASKHQCGLLVPSLRAVTADGPRVLVVDGAALLYSFARTAELGMAQALCGGEYPVLVREVQSFVARLRAVALEPVVFFDGVPEAIKRRTHLARRREEVSALGRLFARINADVAYGAPYQPDGWVPPLLAKETLLRTLAELHVQCHQVSVPSPPPRAPLFTLRAGAQRGRLLRGCILRQPSAAGVRRAVQRQ